MTRALSQDLLWYGYWKRKMVTITVVPNPSDATVTLASTGYTQVGNSISVPVGAVLSWSVAKTPTYNTQSGQFVVTGPDTMAVELSSAPTGVLSITPIPSDSVVTLSAPGCTQVANSITVPLGVTVHCTVGPNNNADLLESSTDIQVVETQQSETLSCNARVTISPTPSDSVANITYAGRTYSGTAIVPYDSRISWSVSHVNYDSQSANNVQILANTTIPVTLQKTMVTFSVTPYIRGTYAPTATVSLSTNAEGVDPVSGLGTQQISIPVGSSVTYSVSQTNYDTVTSVVENITSATNLSITISAHNMGVQYFASNTSWTVPTDDNYKMAVITNGGAGGSCNSAKMFGGLGGGASGNAYVVDLPSLVAGQVLAFNFAANNTVITKDGSDYLSYPNGGNGVSSSAGSLTFDGTSGGSATSGNGGGGGSGGCRTYSVSIPHTSCSGMGRQASCRTWYSVVTYRGVIANGGDGGASGNAGATGDTSTVIGSTYAVSGSGGSGFNSATGGANNGGVYSNSTVSTATAGTGGGAGVGASSSQSTITSKIQAGTLTAAFLRTLMTGGGAGTGGVFSASGDYTASTTVSTPGAGGGGGAWTNGTAGANGIASTTGSAFSSRTGGSGGHGVIIIWRPADYA